VGAPELAEAVAAGDVVDEATLHPASANTRHTSAAHGLIRQR
jgi:hypothetical protein